MKRFKRCSVAKRLPYFRIFSCNFFRHNKFSKVRILRKMACLKPSKSRKKTGDQFTAISDLQNNEERVLFQVGNRQLSRKFSEQVYSPKIPKIFLSQGTRILLLFYKQFLNCTESRIPLKFREFIGNVYSHFLGTLGL